MASAAYAEMTIVDAAIDISDLRVAYGERVAVDGVTCSVASGEFVTVVGPSGCGKSSLLHAVAGFIPCRGRVAAPSRLGVVLQDHGVYPWLTVSGNIGFGLHRVAKAERDQIVREHLALIGMSSHARKYVTQLSGGERQRVALARALAPEPDALLMDEPFAALDTFTRGRMQAWLLEMWTRRRRSVLFVTHDIEEAVFLADRVLVLGSDGRLHGEVSVPLRRPRTESIRYEAELQVTRRKVLALLGGEPRIPDSE